MDDSSAFRWPLRRNVAQSSTPRVKAGETISRGKYGIGETGIGTASLIVREKGASTGALVLTCAHVLGRPAIGEDAKVMADDQVYSPKFKESSGIECNRPFGQVVPKTLEKLAERVVQAQIKIGDEVFAVDAALIKLADKANASNEVPKIGKIAGVRDLIQEWSLTTVQTNLDLPPARQILVKKYGATTQYTEGTIRRLTRLHVKEMVEGQDSPNESEALVFEIEVNAGQEPFSAEYELDMDKIISRLALATPAAVAAQFTTPLVTATVGGSTKTPTLKIVGKTFSQRGDSGAPIVDKDNKIVGILQGGLYQQIFVKDQPDPVNITTGHTRAIFITAALEKLGVTFLAGGQQTAGSPVIVPGMEIERPSREAIDWTALDHARAAIENSPRGAYLSRLVRHHFDEARQLIHHRRRVMVTWHHYKCPGFVAAFLHAVQRPGWPMPVEIDGVRLIDALRALRNVLMAEGSPGLRDAIVTHEHELFDLAGQATSLDNVLAALATTEEHKP